MIRLILALAGLGIVALLGTVVTLYMTSAGDYPVTATVSDDPNLPRIELNGQTFHSETFGKAGDPVIIVLHGGPGGDYQSLLGLQKLADNYLVVFDDQRGAGLSQRVGSEELTATAMIEDLDAFVEHYSPSDPVTLIGHSWGATLAAGYLRYAPDRVQTAVLAEPGYLNAEEAQEWQAEYDKLMSGWSYYRLAIRAGFESQHVNGPDDHAAQDYLVGQRVLPAFANHPDNTYHCPDQPYDAPMRRFGSTASNTLQHETFKQIQASDKELDVPVLFLAGACNDWIGPELQTRHARAYKQSEVAIIPDAGHDITWDNPDYTIATIREFLDQNIGDQPVDVSLSPDGHGAGDRSHSGEPLPATPCGR